MPPSSGTALKSLSDFNTTRKSATDITSESQAKYGIPESNARLSTIRGLVGNLQSSVNAVDPSVTGRTTGSFVTEGQRQALVNKERTPILGQLGAQQSALGQEQENFNTSAGLASQLASSVLSQDQTKYQSLLDQYNAATAAEAEAEKKRQWEATMAEQRRQFDQQQAAAKKASGGGTDWSKYLGGNKTGGGAVAAPVPTGIQQVAYGDVYERINRKDSPQSLMSDYQATAASARKGNQKDLAKLQIYRSLRPDLFKSSYSWEKTGGKYGQNISVGSF